MHSSAGLFALPLAAHQIDRRDADRRRQDWLDEVWSDPQTRVLRLKERSTPVSTDDAGSVAIRYSSPSEIAAQPPVGAVYLGEVQTNGTELRSHVVAVPTPTPDTQLEPASQPSSTSQTSTADQTGSADQFSSAERPEDWADFRMIGAALNPIDAALFTQALAVTAWHSSAPFCAQCGHRTEVRHSGWMRLCPGCGTETFPRTDPAVITAVVDDQGRILLGSAHRWEAQRFSTFAGFVEAGESLEEAVLREVAEEAGVRIRSVQYMGSQSWPFPRSLMLGYMAVAEDPRQACADDDEIREVRWFTPEQLHREVAAGQLRIPPRSSISRALIDHWYGGDVAQGEPADPVQSAETAAADTAEPLAAETSEEIR